MPVETAQSSAHVARRTNGAHPIGRWLVAGRYPIYSFVLLVVVICGMEFASRRGWINPLLIPSPSSVAEAMKNGFANGLYWPHIRSTVIATAWGFGLATLVGMALGGIFASIHWLERLMYPYVIAFQSTPKIAIAPLVIIWAGFGQLSKMIIIALCSFFPILVNTMQGLRLRDKERQELTHVLGASRWQVFRYVRLPGSMPYVFAGLHVGAIFALLGAVVAEFVGSRDGLGVLLLVEQSLFNIPGVFAILLLLMAFGLLINLVMAMIERRVTFWSQEKEISGAA